VRAADQIHKGSDQQGQLDDQHWDQERNKITKLIHYAFLSDHQPYKDLCPVKLVDVPRET